MGSLTRGRRRFFDGLDADFGDTAVVHFDDGQAAGLVGDGFADFGDVAEAHENEAGQGFYATFTGQVPLHLGFEVAEVEAAVHQHYSASGGEGGEGGGVELIFQFAGKLLDGVLGGDQADRGAVLVDHDGDLAAALLEVAEEVEDGFGFRDDEDVAHYVSEGESGIWPVGLDFLRG